MATSCNVVWSESNQYIFYILLLVYIVIFVAVSIYSFNSAAKYKRKYVTAGVCKKIMIYFKDVLDKICTSVTILLHLLAQISNISLIILFYQSSMSNITAASCKSIQFSLFIVALILILIYKLISFISL
eukprot:316939_1